ncbi:MAG: NYN domain-containing protein [Clostridia bacterium]|nr:NYN domain-containing protein [Clostridia bacterium]
MGKVVVGILAHVDAGKTTLAEAMLYKSGSIRKIGRVDNGDTALDTHALERERGITIFAGESHFSVGELDIALLDTPGHVDFSAETERMLKVLDYAILVISGTDGVQSHTRTLWKLLRAYGIPTFVFVTKMDFARLSPQEIMDDLHKLCGESCINFCEGDLSLRNENIAVNDDDLLESFLDTGIVTDDDIRALVSQSKISPCYFGSGLKTDGVDEFLVGLGKYIIPKTYPSEFGAKVYKISHDSKGEKLVHLKVTGGTLKVRSSITYDGRTEKINNIRLYSGTKYTTADEMSAGGICVVTGLSAIGCGDGIGYENSFKEVFLEPVMNYRVVLPDGVDAQTFLPKLRGLEEEDPQLKVSWNGFLREINVSLMGEVQTEILKSLIKERFDIDVEIDSGRVLYKETITNKVEGVGHYEPLRHYAEVHLILEPLERGKGIVITSKCGEDVLDRNWQNLIRTHLAEKEHVGVLTGSPITDVKITLAAGRAHMKHTEGGDFRQATYRAVRQGLMQADTVLLEPYYSFRLEVPTENIGRAINDIRMMSGTIEGPEDIGGISVLTGKAPVVSMNGYASVVASYTSGKGRFFCEVCGYDECHNQVEVVEGFRYSPEADLENTPDSVFCAHGAGFNVKWSDVKSFMHIDSCLEQEKTPYEVTLNSRNFHIDDKELEAIMEREFGKDKHPYYRYSHSKTPAKPVTGEYKPVVRQKYIIVDGYNVIFAWDELKALAADNLEAARDRLADILCNYSAFTKTQTVLVFDAYKVQGNTGKRYTYNNINIAFTKERELGDNYIEKLISDIGRNQNVRVVTSDNLIQLTAVRYGVLRVSAKEFEKELKKVEEHITELLYRINKPRPQKVGELIEIIKSTQEN